MQQFMIPCDFGGRKAPFPIYVGEPKADSHPLHHQSWWLSMERGGTIPQEVMDSFQKLHKISMENNVSFEELCVYAMGEALANPADGAAGAASGGGQQQQPTQAPQAAPAPSTGETAAERVESAPQPPETPEQG